MLFNSFHFILFFILVTTSYFLLPHKFRWLLLLAASCYFYMVFVPVYILILGFTIFIDYFAGIFLEKNSGSKRKYFLIASLIANIGVLAVFKYYNFFTENIARFLDSLGYRTSLPRLGILLPIGLSFHTFQAMSYTIEVFRGNQKAERNFGIYALYVMFYPQLVAGPIERPQNLIHQFKEKHPFEYKRITEGLKLMLWGFFMKVVIADRLAIFVNDVYNNPMNYNGKTLALATVFFSFQIYCDFAGYSNIAIGVAKVMGINLMTNFNRPYFSKGISEFWKRWHISLSTWFRDYFYIPLGGNRVRVSRIYLNLLLVFLVSGLWHGANWTFIVWGLINGLYLLIGKSSEGIWNRILKKTLPNILIGPLAGIRIIITFLLASFAWIFFRANSLGDALNITSRICQFSGSLIIGKSQLVIALSGIIFLIIVEFFNEYHQGGPLPFKTNHWLKEQICYSLLLISILFFGEFSGSRFIYFQF